jgi:hypothetical protein
MNNENTIQDNLEMFISLENSPGKERYLKERQQLFQAIVTELNTMRPFRSGECLFELKKIRDAVCEVFGISISDFHRKSRKTAVVQSRYVFLIICNDYHNNLQLLDYSVIRGAAFCGLASSTAYTQEAKYRRFVEMRDPRFVMKSDRILAKKYNDIKNNLKKQS